MSISINKLRRDRKRNIRRNRLYEIDLVRMNLTKRGAAGGVSPLIARWFRRKGCRIEPMNSLATRYNVFLD